ncbi:MAG: Lrp/AsnC family transcriptional regulator [Chloroflexi bacterium]|nr:Lrp/AsnC family transcriptional regulator [Chloroflexota bacterium]
MQAYVLIKTHVGDIYPALGILRRISEVVSAYSTFGPYDIIALVEAADMDALSHLVTRRIQGISEVLETTTCIVMSEPKT